MSNDNLVTEVPSSLKQLARSLVRGFYTIEDALIIDMLVRNPCMKEDDICELLKFERKQLRARVATLKKERFIQTRLRMETGIDGKAQKVNYYFINYMTFVNVVKYKLDTVRKKLETEERDATSRASFKCPKCSKSFTDLEADQLFDFMSQEFRCTYCGSIVEEDQSAMPRQDSRQMMVKFNSQLEQVFIILREVEGIRLAPKILEPEPVDINTIRGLTNKSNMNKPGDGQWSGEASRNQGFLVEEARVDIQFGDKEAPKENNKKERPVWMVESTVLPSGFNQTNVIVEDSNNSLPELETMAPSKGGEDIMSYLLQHERRSGTNQTNLAAASLSHHRDDSGDSDNDMDNIMDSFKHETSQDVDAIESDEEEEEEMPSVTVGETSYLLSEIDDKVIGLMTPVEKSNYISVYQDYYSRVYD